MPTFCQLIPWLIIIGQHLLSTIHQARQSLFVHTPRRVRTSYLIDLQDSLQKSNALKVEGNDHFRAGRWREAIAAYESALLELPKTVSAPPQVPPPFRENTSSEGDENESSKPAEGVSTISESSLLPAEANECAKARAILNANSGACYVKLVSNFRVTSSIWTLIAVSKGDHQKAVEACSQGGSCNILLLV